MSTGPATAAIALGSNLGDRMGYIRAGIAAVGAMPGTRLAAISSTIQTPAEVLPGAPSQPPYLNAVVLIRTELAPGDLLTALLEIERGSGRDRSAAPSPATRWQPRTLDLDVLFVDRLVITDRALTIPHPHMHSRRFVLEPLSQLAPEWVHPIRNESVTQMLRRVQAGDAGR